jgi:probable rRNA maturation factor
MIDLGEVAHILGAGRSKSLVNLFNKMGADYGFRIKSIGIRAVSSLEMIELNTYHLNHNYDTDILTFNYTEKQALSGDLIVSTPYVYDSATRFGVSYENELCRVLIHGVLHLLGENDLTDQQRLQMRGKENHYLSMVNFNNVSRGTI